MSYEVETGIEMPVRWSGRTERFPFSSLEIGQSFLVPGGNLKKLRSNAQGAALKFAEPTGRVRQTKSGKMKQEVRKTRTFFVANVEGGVRVWRKT